MNNERKIEMWRVSGGDITLVCIQCTESPLCSFICELRLSWRGNSKYFLTCFGNTRIRIKLQLYSLLSTIFILQFHPLFTFYMYDKNNKYIFIRCKKSSYIIPLFCVVLRHDMLSYCIPHCVNRLLFYGNWRNICWNLMANVDCLYKICVSSQIFYEKYKIQLCITNFKYAVLLLLQFLIF